MKARPETKMIIMGGVDCTPESEAKFNKWYDEIHIPILLRSGEVERVVRFKRVGDDKNYPKYLIIYELEDQQAYERYEKSLEKAEAVEEMRQTWKTGGARRRWRVQYEVIATAEKGA